MSDDKPEMEVLTWEEYGKASVQLAQEVASSDFKPDIILAIARGGLFLAGSIGYELGVKNISVINVELYTGVHQKLEVPVMLPPFLDKANIQDMNVLICDDIADSGETLESVSEYCAGVVASSQTAVLYEKASSIVKPDFVWKRADKWIDFPWSSAY